ncbi:prohead core scaffold protein and protease [Pseudomonas phage PspYZU05]|uniref:Prohead core scaffold protein and protease n=1 Tax=Pseudomonas phage PspYZU05 TaxID=1983556 RepID=A0A2U7N542_9CAUD|nr:prohead core scaffold protein and protease [Pseudomonas phage PspYZU05]ASD52086.1 prohead core scaffold protein and protease [Pseudomonas phage PspYZU05]
MEDMLLVEDWGLPGAPGESLLTIVESTNSRNLKPGLYIEGVFLQANVVNGNKRLYPRVVLEKAVSKYITEQVSRRQALGELNHPARANVDPNLAAILIEEMWWEGDNVMGRARVIEGDNGPGDKLAANIRAGWVPGVSSRGLGKVVDSGRGYSIVQEGFRLTVGVDAVWGPSAPDAYVSSIEINESVVNEQKQENPFVALMENMRSRAV